MNTYWQVKKRSLNSIIKTIKSKNLQYVFAVIVLFSLSACSPWQQVNEKVSDSHYYSLLKTSVIYFPMGNTFTSTRTEIDGADVDTFVPLSSYYAIDKNYVFYKSKILNGEKPDAFRKLDGSYAVGQYVYLRGEIIPEADTESFIILEYFESGNEPDFYGKDKNFVFAAREIISNEPENFKLMGQGKYFYDSKDVYDVHSRKALGADPQSFTFLHKPDGSPSVYAADKSHVFYVDSYYPIIKQADLATFEVLCAGDKPPYFAKDMHHYYYFNNIMKNVNSNNFSCDMNTENIEYANE
jgi:hypothetical protein